VIEPGAVFEIPARLANPPQAAHRHDPARRESRWVVVVDTEAHCLDPRHLTVFTVLLSSQVEWAGPEDVTVLALEGLPADSIAQTDLVFTLAKSDLTGPRYRTTLQADSLFQIRATLEVTMGFASTPRVSGRRT
jgi:hypothetical protein